MPLIELTPLMPVQTVKGYGGTSSNGEDTQTGGGVPRVDTNPRQVCGLVPLTDCDETECRSVVERQCCWMLDVFGDTTVDTTKSTYENDITNFTVDYQLHAANPSVTVVIRLYECTTVFPAAQEWSIVASMTGTTYGTNIAFGDYTQCPNYRGYIVNWGKVLSLHGAGVYKIQFSSSFAGVENCLESPPFNLRAFDCRWADGTVKFDIKATGQIGSLRPQGYIHSLCGFNYIDSIRLPGMFGQEIISEYLEVYNEYQNGTMNQVRNEAVQAFKFYSKLWTKEYHDRIKVYALMADVLKVSDYNYANSDYYIDQLRIVRSGNYAPEYYEKNRVRMQKVTVEFKAGVQNIIKSLCCKLK